MRYARKTVGARLGQHFLTGQWAARTLARAAEVRAGETILEIGPGKGALTKELLATGNKVIAVEKDPALVGQLEETFAKEIVSGALRVIAADVRDVDVMYEPGQTVPDARRGESGARDVPKRTTSATLRLRNEADGIVLPGGYVVAANIPYYITGEILRTFLTTQKQPRAMALLVQKEVAERIIARDGKESILSLSVKAYGTPKIIAKVSRGNFSPPPSVDSAILLIENISRAFFTNVDENAFFKLVRAGFSSKRKLLASNLSGKNEFTKPILFELFTACDIPEKARAEDVPLEKWRRLTLELEARSHAYRQAG